MDPAIIFALATAIAAPIAGWFTTTLFDKQIKRKQLDTKQAEVIVEAIKSEEASRRAATLEFVLQKLPAQPDASLHILQTLDEVVKRLPAAQTSTPDSPAIENLINGYHEQALGQASAQFWFSVVAAIVGFGMIIYAGLSIQTDSLQSVTKTFPGMVMDAVAYLFFKQASETRQRATELYDRLRKDKQLTEAVSLVSSIADAKLKSTVQAQIALHMSGLNSSPIDLSKFLEK